MKRSLFLLALLALCSCGDNLSGKFKKVDNRIADVEEDQGYLEREVTDFARTAVDADRAVKDLREEVAMLRKELGELRERTEGGR